MGVFDEIGAEARKHWKVTIALVLFFPTYFFRAQMGFSTMPTSFLMYAVFIVSLAVGDALWGKWRYGTRQYVDLAGHGSVKAPGVYPVGDWDVIALGSVDFEGFSWEGGQGTRVVPRSSVEIHPTFILSWSRPVLREKKHLPSEVQAFIEGKRAFGGPYYFSTTDLKPSHIENVYETIVDLLTDGNKSNPLSPKDLEARLNKLDDVIKIALAEIDRDYHKEVTRNNERFTEMQGVITTQQELLGDKYRTIADMADALGMINRSLKKIPYLERFKGKEKGEAPS